MTFRLNKASGSKPWRKPVTILIATLLFMFVVLGRVALMKALIPFPLLFLWVMHTSLYSVSFKENRLLVKTELGIRYAFDYSEIRAFFGGAKNKASLRLARPQAESFSLFVMKYKFIPLFFTGSTQTLDEADMLVRLMEERTGKKGRFAV